MAYSIPGSAPFSKNAGVDLSASQDCGVLVNSAGNAVLPTLGGRMMGIVQNKPKLNETAALYDNGSIKWKAGGVINIGDEVTVDASGRCIAAVTTGHRRHGWAELASGAAGTFITVRLALNGPAVP